MTNDQISTFVSRYIDGEYLGLAEYTRMVVDATQAADRAVLSRIAEVDGPIECSSLREWREKVKKIALNALNGVKK